MYKIYKLTIIPLGRVSLYCKNEMNRRGFLIKYKEQNILLDCENDLKNMSVIVSHFHKEHYWNLGGIQYVLYVYHNLGKIEQPINIYLTKEDFASGRESIILNKDSYVELVTNDEFRNIYISQLRIKEEQNY